MHSKASIAGHPIHPALVAFPVALYTATVAALLVHVGTHDVFWYRAAMWANLAGVAMAAVAAIPGAIDLFALPRRSRARVTGLRHAGFNVLSLVLFAVSAVILWRNVHGTPDDAGIYRLDTNAPLVLGIVGLLSTVTAGMLGWTLVQTHHVGVRPTVYGSHRDPSVVDDLDELAGVGPAPRDITPSARVEDRHFTDRLLRH
ncbi:MAG: DUF2231 domain-containing protein [Deltaproteobacteria bacterium]|nr:DUF2231 domain-containing protein [Deltaproteobacteria bacterium]